MRSSKSRSRNKTRTTSRPTGGNIINRVFDSSGPEGKVRGTPQQIIEKYNQLHRDSQVSNDRVAAENFAQHAEHYTRLLAEAMRDVEKSREEQEQFNRDRQADRDRERTDRLRQQEDVSNGQNSGNGDQPDQPREQRDNRDQPRDNRDQPRDQRDNRDQPREQREPRENQQPRENREPRENQQPRENREPREHRRPDPVAVIDSSDQPDTGLVDTPETSGKPRRPRGRKPRPEGSDAGPASDPAEAAE